MPSILIDADACPVKDEVFRVAKRHGLQVKVVANVAMRVPDAPWVEMVQVGDGFDAADDWIVEHAAQRDIVVTDDILLAARCLNCGATVLSAKGRAFSDETIGGALANREFLSQLREHGLAEGGPSPFSAKDRSRFLQRLDLLARRCQEPHS